MRKLLFFFIIALMANACNQTTQSKDENNNNKFDALKGNFIEDLWKLYPGWASYVGYHKYDSVLTIPNEEHRQEQMAFCDKYLELLEGFEENQLSANNFTDLKIMENQLKSMRWGTTEFKAWEWQPSQYNVGGGFGRMLNETFAPLDERLRNISIRLEKVPDYYETARAQISHPTLEHTELAILQNKGALGVFGANMIDSIDQSGLGETERHDMKAKIELAKMAIEDYLKWLEDDLKPRLAEGEPRSFRIGEEAFNKKFKYDIASAYSAEEIYEKALAHKDTLHKEMAALTEEMWDEYFPETKMPKDKLVAIKQMIDELSKNHVHRDSFQAAIEANIPELENFVREKDLIYLDPDKPLVVRREPEYMAGVAGASVSSPGPYEKDGNTYYNVGSLANYSDEEVESYLREYNHYILQILNIHEAVPGHYTQLVYSNQSPSIIKSILGNGTMVEGWAVYTERMMLEEGYGSNKPEMWLMYYKWNLRTTCNTIIDHEIHCGDMTEEQALDLMINEAFQEEKEARNKWRRARLTQVQLSSYFTGFMEIYEFREEYKHLLGKDFNLKEFHEKFLSYGSAPVKEIRNLMLKELAEETLAAN